MLGVAAIQAARGFEEFRVRAFFNNPAAVDYNNSICVFDGGEAMGNDQCRSIHEKPQKRLLD